MSKVFQIYETDLEVLERELPAISSACEMSPAYNGNKCLKDALGMVKKIVSDVRWNYGPAQESHKVED